MAVIIVVARVVAKVVRVVYVVIFCCCQKEELLQVKELVVHLVLRNADGEFIVSIVYFDCY